MTQPTPSTDLTERTYGTRMPVTLDGNNRAYDPAGHLIGGILPVHHRGVTVYTAILPQGLIGGHRTTLDAAADVLVGFAYPSGVYVPHRR